MTCPNCIKIRGLIHKSTSIDMGNYTEVKTDDWDEIIKWAYEDDKDKLAPYDMANEEIIKGE